MPRLPGLGTTRSGRPPIGLQTLIDRSHRLKRAEVSIDDAEEAARALQRGSGRLARLRDYTLAGSIGKPMIRVMGSMTEHGLEGLKKGPSGVRKGVLKGLGHGFTRTMEVPGMARQAVEGGVGGGLLAGTRELLEARRAKRIARQFLDEGEKTAEQKKLAEGLQRSIGILMRKFAFAPSPPSLPKRIQPVPTSKLLPIVDDDYDFEV